VSENKNEVFVWRSISYLHLITAFCMWLWCLLPVLLNTRSVISFLSSMSSHTFFRGTKYRCYVRNKALCSV
jgi:hypothetical protein